MRCCSRHHSRRLVEDLRRKAIVSLGPRAKVTKGLALFRASWSNTVFKAAISSLPDRPNRSHKLPMQLRVEHINFVGRL